MKKIILAVVLSLSAGCALTSYDFQDPNKALVLMQVKRGGLHMAHFEGLDGQPSVALMDVYYLNNGCQVLVLPTTPGRYKLKEILSHGNTNAYGYEGSYNTYSMKKSSSALEFEAKPGEVAFIGSYTLKGNTKSFTLEKSRECGSEKDAWRAFDENQLKKYPGIYDPVWTAPVRKRLATLK